MFAFLTSLETHIWDKGGSNDKFVGKARGHLSLKNCKIKWGCLQQCIVLPTLYIFSLLVLSKCKKIFQFGISNSNCFSAELATLHCREYLVFTSHTSSFGWVAPSWVWHLLDWKTNIFRTIWNDEKKTAKHRESTAVGRSAAVFLIYCPNWSIIWKFPAVILLLKNAIIVW